MGGERQPRRRGRSLAEPSRIAAPLLQGRSIQRKAIQTLWHGQPSPEDPICPCHPLYTRSRWPPASSEATVSLTDSVSCSSGIAVLLFRQHAPRARHGAGWSTVVFPWAKAQRASGHSSLARRFSRCHRTARPSPSARASDNGLTRRPIQTLLSCCISLVREWRASPCNNEHRVSRTTPPKPCPGDR